MTHLKQISEWKKRGDKIVFTNGCFDLLHAGHVKLLIEASHFGDKLIVGINSDLSIKKIKGNNRPIIPIIERIVMLEAICCVDLIIVFNGFSPIQLIREIKPDILVKGDDYEPESVVGREYLACNGEIKIVNRMLNISTTSIINKIREIKC